jgi:hypothetical protein
MTKTTRSFPATLSGRVEDLIPSFCRSIRMNHEDDGTCTLTAHASEIDAARKAVRIARDEAATTHIR